MRAPAAYSCSSKCWTHRLRTHARAHAYRYARGRQQRTGARRAARAATGDCACVRRGDFRWKQKRATRNGAGILELVSRIMAGVGTFFVLVVLQVFVPQPSGGQQSGSCTSLPDAVRRGLAETLNSQTSELAEQFNMSFTVGVAMCDGSEMATSAGLDDRFAHTPLSS